MKTKTRERLGTVDMQKIFERAQRATPGPWVVCREHPVLGTIGGPVCYMDEDEDVCVGQACDFGPTNDPMHDADFIAHARTDIPRLLAEVQTLRIEIAGLRSHVRLYTEHFGDLESLSESLRRGDKSRSTSQ